MNEHPLRIATEEDLEIARRCLDDKDTAEFRFDLAYKAAQEAGLSLNASHVARVLGVDRRRVGEWMRKRRVTINKMLPRLFKRDHRGAIITKL